MKALDEGDRRFPAIAAVQSARAHCRTTGIGARSGRVLYCGTQKVCVYVEWQSCLLCDRYSLCVSHTVTSVCVCHGVGHIQSVSHTVRVCVGHIQSVYVWDTYCLFVCRVAELFNVGHI